jgi:hypothetical protein
MEPANETQMYLFASEVPQDLARSERKLHKSSKSTKNRDTPNLSFKF